MQALGNGVVGALRSRVMDVPVNMLHKFQQFYEFDILVAQFIDRVLDIAVMPLRQVRKV